MCSDSIIEMTPEQSVITPPPQKFPIAAALFTYLSGSAFVMSMRGRVTMGRLVGLLWLTGSSSGVSDLTLSLSFSACRHDSGGSCRLPENRLWTMHSSTPRVVPGHRDASLFS